MDIETIFNQYLGKDFTSMKASEFADMIITELERNGYECKREARVKNRGDGRAGRIDVVAHLNYKMIAIEFDNCSPRVKSVYKLSRLPREIRKFCILRKPFKVFDLSEY